MLMDKLAPPPGNVVLSKRSKNEFVYLNMETIRINIVNPKAKRILKELADLNLIAIREKDPIKSFQKLLSKLGGKKGTISLDEITKEVELVRGKVPQK